MDSLNGSECVHIKIVKFGPKPARVDAIKNQTAPVPANGVLIGLAEIFKRIYIANNTWKRLVKSNNFFVHK